MGWKESNLVSLRSEFVRLALVEGVNRSQLCERFGISRKTGYKWIQRYCESGQIGLEDHSRRPKNSPRKTDDTVEQAVLQVREQHPAWGGRKIRQVLDQQGMKSPPSPSTITAILHRH